MIAVKRTRLRHDAVEAYERIHREIPVELHDDLLAAGVRQWHIWRDGVDLIHVIEVDDREAMGRRMADSEANRAWQAIIGPLLSDDQPGSGSDLPLVWKLL